MQQLVIENLELRVSSISSDLCPEEQTKLNADIKQLSADYNALNAEAKAYEQELDRSVGERQVFETQLDEIQRKLAGLTAQSQGYELLPLSSAATEKIADKFKVKIIINIISNIFVYNKKN